MPTKRPAPSSPSVLPAVKPQRLMTSRSRHSRDCRVAPARYPPHRGGGFGQGHLMPAPTANLRRGLS